MVNYELEGVLSAIRAAMISAVGKNSMKTCKALEVFDFYYEQIMQRRETEILGELGVFPNECEDCCNCTATKSGDHC